MLPALVRLTGSATLAGSPGLLELSLFVALSLLLAGFGICWLRRRVRARTTPVGLSYDVADAHQIPTPQGGCLLSSIAELTELVRAFAHDRGWEQFHTPKNLAMALAGEVGELLAELQWLTPEQSAAVMDDRDLGPRVRAEIGDVTIYLVRLADVLGIDLVQAAADKLADSGRRYTIEAAHGSAAKIGGDHPTGS